MASLKPKARCGEVHESLLYAQELFFVLTTKIRIFSRGGSWEVRLQMTLSCGSAHAQGILDGGEGLTRCYKVNDDWRGGGRD